MNIFVTGTDTDVGKTIVSTWLCVNTNAFYWKPIQTGSDHDRKIVETFSPHTRIVSEIYKLNASLSPYNAAKMENLLIDKELFKQEIDNTIIEGTGGALVPIWPDFYMADIAKFYSAKVVIVAKSKLGGINQVLMTAEVLQIRDIDILGIIITGEIENNIKQTIELFSGLKVIGVLPFSKDLNNVLLSTRIPKEISEIIQ